MLSSPSTLPPHTSPNDLDDDGRRKRKGTVWTAIADITTALIGSGILSFPWDISQLGWIFGVLVILLFSLVTCYTSTLLADCYRSQENGNRNYTYIHAVQYNFGGMKGKLFRIFFYMYLLAIAIDYTKESSTNITSIWSSNCFDHTGEKKSCNVNHNLPYIIFGIIQVILSQIPGFHQYRCVTIVNTLMCFTYPTIAIGLGIAKIAGTGKFRGSLTGIGIGTVTASEKIGRIFKALGQIAFAYSFFNVFFEIQDTIKSSPAEGDAMKKASLIGIGVATMSYILSSCFGYATFGDLAPTNLLTGFVSYKSNWLTNIASAALLIHLIGSYQFFSQPLFEFVEKITTVRFADIIRITREIETPVPGSQPYNLKLFRLIWGTIFVIVTTVIPMFLPFIDAGVGAIGAIGFWVLTIYFPIEIHTVQKNIPKWSRKWVWFQIIKFVSLIITIAATAGSIGVAVLDLKSHK